MAVDVVMPRLSDSMEEGTILGWMKSVGDEVAVGDELVEIETDKANMVYEADVAGTLLEILAKEDETVSIGAVIARVGAPGEAPQRAGDAKSPDGGGSDSPPPVAPEATRAARSDQPRPAPVANGRVKASPLARRIAREQGLALAEITGSGPGGRIVKADVERRLASGPAPAEEPLHPLSTKPPAPGRARTVAGKGEVETVELTRLQATVARRMVASKATAPHFQLAAEIDMSSSVSARTKIRETAAEGDVVPSVNDMVVKACALALREHPRVNGSYRDGTLELYSRINVGVAVAAQGALVVPTVFDADRKGLREIAAETRALAERVREGTVTPPELSGGTFTVSNLGMYGVSNFQAVINPPQAAILAVGEVVERPVVRDGEITTAQLMGVTLGCDHRILSGADGAEFLARVRALLEDPLVLAL